MTIQRQYSLPNCTLVLEGLGDAASLNQADPRPLMSVLINAECYLVGLNQPLSGGREFLEHMVKAVSRYAQEFFSGLHRSDGGETPLVQLERIGSEIHRLNVRSPKTDATQPQEPGLIQVDLTTVQLFDLTEAIDQFLADSRTLPDLAFALAPTSKRAVDRSEAIHQQAGPLAIGVSGLALATLALFAVPVPKVQEPKELFPGAASTTSSSPTASPSASASPKDSQAAPSGNSASPDKANSTDLNDLTAKIDAAPAITDAATLDDLSQKLRTALTNARNAQNFPQRDLIYRVGVAQDGTIIGFKASNPDALDNAKETPLLDLVYRKVPSDRPANEPLAQFRVLFTPTGVVEVTPWESSSTAVPTPDAGEITDSRQLEELLAKVRTELNRNWKTTPNLREDLTYQIRVKPDGSILDYKAENPAAAELARETPLAEISKPVADSNAETVSGSYALFKVVFKSPDGAVELSPWRGWPN